VPTSCLNKRNGVIAAAILLIAAVVAGLLLTTEPTFEERSLSYWMDQLPSIDIGVDGRSESIYIPGSGSICTTEEELTADNARINKNIGKAHKALDTIGTNHFSMLVARLQSQDSRVMTIVWVWAERMHIIHDAEIHLAKLRRGQALHAFSYLGARARPVVPQLLALTTNQNANTRLLAWSALERVALDEFHKRKHPPIIQHAPR
jgi:hypothetical protein